MSAIQTVPAYTPRNGSEQAIHRAIQALRAAVAVDAPTAIRACLEYYRCRRDLRHLLRVSPYIIDDIGLTRTEVWRELKNPFWRP
jgi:uncharacterized protein YjiS (DUF1127 family)